MWEYYTNSQFCVRKASAVLSHAELHTTNGNSDYTHDRRPLASAVGYDFIWLSLVGMQVKNAIVLMDEITARKAAGDSDYDAIVSAGVSRLRPVFNASLTTVLGMLPLLADAFYASMAVTIMVGLTFATILTMVVIPVNYALVFRVRKPPAS